jgi:hypothetical protein
MHPVNSAQLQIFNYALESSVFEKMKSKTGWESANYKVRVRQRQTKISMERPKVLPERSQKNSSRQEMASIAAE